MEETADRPRLFLSKRKAGRENGGQKDGNGTNNGMGNREVKGPRMKIEYKRTKIFDAAQLQRLFSSVKWESGNYPVYERYGFRQYDNYSAMVQKRFV